MEIREHKGLTYHAAAVPQRSQVCIKANGSNRIMSEVTFSSWTRGHPGLLAICAQAPQDVAIKAQPGVRNHLSKPSTENW